MKFILGYNGEIRGGIPMFQVAVNKTEDTIITESAYTPAI
jgi:hypothetical protein